MERQTTVSMHEIFSIHDKITYKNKAVGEMADIETIVITDGNRTDGALDCMGVVSTVIMGGV